MLRTRGDKPPAPEHVQTRRLIPALLASRPGPVGPSAEGGGVLQEVSEPFRARGRDLGQSCGDRGGDPRQLPLDGRRHVPFASFHQGFQPSDREVEPLQRRHLVGASPPVLIERDDLCHVLTIVRGSDTDRGTSQATRTLVTGARRSCTENQCAPASGDPKTSPLVAPKNSPMSSPAPSRARACRRIVRYASSSGSPSASAVHDAPASRVP